jgi:hypothetical protein
MARQMNVTFKLGEHIAHKLSGFQKNGEKIKLLLKTQLF